MERVENYDAESTEKKGVGSSDRLECDETSNGAADHKPLIVHGTSRRLTGPARRSSKANWTEEEVCGLLFFADITYVGSLLTLISECLPGRTDVQCLHRWQKVLSPDLVKGPWSKEEDDLLIEFVQKQGNRKWSEIAEHLPGRIGKQCRERWCNHLNPDINKAAWTKEEEMILRGPWCIWEQMVELKAFTWEWIMLSKIVEFIDFRCFHVECTRTENSVKNHWNCSLKKKLHYYLASDSALNHPRSARPALHGNKTETNQKFVGAKRNISTKCLHKEKVHPENDGESCCPNLVSEYSGYISSTPQETLSKHLPLCLNSTHDVIHDDGNLTNSIRPRRHSDICNNLGMHQSSSDWSYTGLCYKPIQSADLNIFLETGGFPSTDSYIHQPNRSKSVPLSRSRMKASADSYSSPNPY
ncbi:UNVERIFIED_CONTAM: Transcription factor R-1 [Sesamum radiatum]|uniref:Transcription factor R-1 n=1 Tax=Sesamum radiatum TaxID=300843 RepID=A0AAW2V8Z5_SESRA